MERSRIRWCGPVPLLAMLLALAPAGLVGQSQADTLRLEQALELARGGNPDVRKAGNEVERAGAFERARWGSFLPEVTGGGSLVDRSSRTVTAQNEFGQPVALDDPARFSTTSAVGSIGASMTLFDGFRNVNELQAARSRSEEAEALVGAERLRVEAEVRRRFHAALAAERLVAVEERLLAAAEERVSATESMSDAGRATPQDVLGAEVELAHQQMSLDEARADAHTASLLLGEILGVSGGSTLVADGELPAPELPEDLDVERMVATALEQSPRMRRAEAAAERADHVADAARSSRWPTIQLNAGYNREISLGDASQLTSYPWNRGVSFGLSASVPVFNGFSTSAQVADARISRENADEDLRAARLAIERTVRMAFTELELARRSMRLAERAADLSRRRLDAGQEGFRRGMIGFTELQQLIAQAAQAERSTVRARLRYADAVATMDEAVGGAWLGHRPDDH